MEKRSHNGLDVMSILLFTDIYFLSRFSRKPNSPSATQSQWFSRDRTVRTSYSVPRNLEEAMVFAVVDAENSSDICFGK